MTEEKFDAIVVGAGVAGSASALRMAQKGLQVVLIERGPYPGSKNLSGGVLYGRVLQELIPNYWEEAPVERCITNQVVSFMTAGASFNIDFKNQAFNQPPYNAFTVLRAKFDRWLAEKAEEAGAMLVPGIKVERVLKDSSGRVIGVSAGGEEILADVVIAADGATSFLAQEAGLRGRIPTRHVATGVKQVIGLPREVIEERFHLTGDEGAAYTIVGYATRGVAGGGFLYTNRESLSVGLVMRLDDLVRTRSRSGEIMEDFLASPAIAPFIRGGKLLEYGAHLVPEGGVDMMPQLFTGGMLVVGDAAGLGINSGFVIRGMDLAIGSAIAAADTVVEAKARGDFSAQSLSAYQEKLEQSFVMKDMRTYRRAPHFMENERLYKTYPELLARIMTEIYDQDAQGKEHLLPTIMKSLKACNVSLLDLARDAVEGVRAL
ncbi:MAG: FAD-dependent oxidoreductase [Chloroflexi bacterium]|nr:FAD-dependent oxidoreductase [Chloroflexota bacterium]